MPSIFQYVANLHRRREIRKVGKHLLRQTRYLRSSRLDILTPKQLTDINGLEARCQSIIAGPQILAAAEEASTELNQLSVSTAPGRRVDPKMRETVEIIVVALAVALGFRTYFFQPFKIPTASMESTLSGIHVENLASDSWLTRFRHVKLLTWIIDGVYIKEVRAKASGLLEFRGKNSRSNTYEIYIGGKRHRIPAPAIEKQLVSLHSGQFVSRGELLWRGAVTAGDHVFVDKIRWNFLPPRRGQVVVFRTDGIAALDQGIHYIKRLIGLPGETLTLEPPNVVIDGVTNGNSRAVEHVAAWPGYTLRPDVYGEDQRGRSARFPIGPDSYFCLGDNTTQSSDSRYWGTVPEPNMVGPAVLVYWPFGPKWGLIKWPRAPR